jgi:hypothetical protein
MTTAKCFPFTLEVKFRQQWSWKRFVEGKSSPVWGWWVQCQDAAHEAGREPMLWLRKGGMGWHVLLRLGYVAHKLVQPPDYAWSELVAVNVGVQPVMYSVTRLIANPPKVFAV